MKYYFIGIKGTGMSSLATILKQMGNEVCGSDVLEHFFTEESLKKNNIEIYGFNNSNIDQYITSDTIIVKSDAFTEDNNIEVRKCIEKGLKVFRYSEILGDITKKYKTIAISGCHGKTTTTSLLSHVLKNTIGCSYLIGDSTGYGDKDSNYFVLEACEYRRNFLHYYPTYTIITNIDLDHVDYYKNIDDCIDAYTSFINQTKDYIICCGDDSNINKIKTTKKMLKYGFNENNDIICKNVVYSDYGTKFDVYINNEFYDTFNLPIFGVHMVLNTLAVIGICYLENVDKKMLEDILSTFKGAKRRFSETVFGDIVTIDDYGHHPTEVKATINAIRQKYPEKEVVIIFEPHTYSRIKDLHDDFVSSLNLADKAYVMDIASSAREKQEDYVGVNYHLILDYLKNGEHISIETVEKLLRHKNAVIVLMSPKDNLIKLKYEDLLKNNCK